MDLRQLNIARTVRTNKTRWNINQISKLGNNSVLYFCGKKTTKRVHIFNELQNKITINLVYVSFTTNRIFVNETVNRSLEGWITLG